MERSFWARLKLMKERQSRGSVLFAENLRSLTEPEVLQLQNQGNLSDSWELIRVVPEFDGQRIHFNRFSGRVVLGRFEIGRGIYHSWLENTEVGHHALVDHAVRLRNTVMDTGSEVLGSSIDCSKPTRFGMGSELKAGLETTGKEIPLWDSMTLESAQNYLVDNEWQKEVQKLLQNSPVEFSYLAPQSRVEQTLLADQIFVDEGGRVEGSVKIINSALLGSCDEPITLGGGVWVEDSVLQWGVKVESGAQVRRSALLEYSAVERGGLVSDSLIGPNTTIAEGEVTACFLGPFIGFHHQSLLIAAYWPEGRGNIGYGANIGSNHTSRAPDQEFYPGEGTFFGLASAVKFPAHFGGAPYSILSTGVVTLPQKLSMPFSLILDEPKDTEGCRGLNRIIPGWVLKENLYTLLRNERKYQERNRARRHLFDFRIFKPAIADCLWFAFQALDTAQGLDIYTGKEIPGLGKNYLLEEDRRTALRVYDRFLRYIGLRLYAETALGEEQVDSNWLKVHFQRLKLDEYPQEEILSKYLDMEKENWQFCLDSKKKDDVRGRKIIPDYESFHASAEEDSFIKKQHFELHLLEERIQKMCQKKA